MSTMLERVIHDFEEEVDAIKHERFSSLRFTLKRFLRSLRMMDACLLDGYEKETVLKMELKRILTEAETELGALLRTNQRYRVDSEHHRRITTFLQKLDRYRDELCPPSSIPRANSFRIPLFTRSDSFKSVHYEPPAHEGVSLDGNSRQVSVRFQRETVRASFEFFRNGSMSSNRQSAPPRPPPPGKPGSKPKKKSEIRRIPKVVKLFHTFKSRSTEPVSSKRETPVPKVRQANPAAVIEELMAKSQHVQKINEEVELHGGTVQKWAEEIKTAEFKSIEEVNDFVVRMDKSMGETLTDEVVILKRIGNWPKRYDVMREASASWKQLKDMEATLLSCRLNERNEVGIELKRIQELIDRTDAKLQIAMRHHQQQEKRYSEARIPWSTSVFETVKVAALVPIELYLKTVHQQSPKLQTLGKKRRLFSDCATFAFKGHQLVGGFNEACSQAFARIEAAAHSVMPGISQDKLSFPLPSPHLSQQQHV